MLFHSFKKIVLFKKPECYRLNGLYVWLPDVLNRVLTGDGEGLTACEVIAQRLNHVCFS